MNHEPPESIAIVGMAGRFPQAKNLQEFWQNLRAGKEAVSFFQDGDVRWLPIEHPPRLDDPRFVKARAVLEKPEWFDAAFFHINPKEAEIMDPQHRVFMECCWEALENAGCNPDGYDGLIGVFAGASMNTYLLTNLMTNRGLVEDFGLFSTMIMNDGDFVPTRVSYKLNLRGPSINVQTACSTSLVAVCLAAQNLLGYRCDVALAGGVSITFPATRGQHHLEGGILSHDGHCRAFDGKASGTVLGDGAGVVVLKRLSDALENGDHIHAVIKGTAINNDGAVKIGYTAPSIDGQAECIALAQSEAGVAPETISYIEAHGTGTPLGDPIEIAGLTKAFGLKGERGQFCAVGSVKSNIGHLDIGAGVAGLIKTVLALQHEEIPPSLHFESPNPKIDFAHSPFFVNHALRPWPKGQAPRRAGVSSFGIGGTNAHAVVEEAPAVAPSAPAHGPQVLLVSARTATALDAATDNLATHLQANPQANLADVAFTLQTGRKIFAHRRAVVCDSVAHAVEALSSRDPKRTATGASDNEEASVAFMFTGQGAQTIDMARGLYETDAAFRAEVDRSCEILRPKLGLDLRGVMFPGVGRVVPNAPSGGEPAENGALGITRPTSEQAAKLLNETRVTQPALFVIEYALAQLWMRRGMKPAAMIGHSLGEYVAACVAGVFSLEDALALVAERARLMQAQAPGAMTAVRVAEADIAQFLQNNLALAAVNAPGLCVVSGPFDEIEALEKKLAASAIGFKRLATSHAFHSAMMEPALTPLAQFVERLKRSTPKIPWVSNLTGTWITPEQATSAEYWTKHLRSTVRFADGVGELVKAGHRVLLEVGPGSTLASLAKQHPAVANGEATAIATLAGDADDPAKVMLALGRLWIAGVKIDWRDGVHGGERRLIVPLPTYPFERKRYWIEPGATLAIANVGASLDDARSVVRASSSDALTEESETPAEASTLAALRELFQRLSGVDVSRASADTTFYELGFDSLFLTQASQAVSRKFGVDVTFRQLREDLTTLAKLTSHIESTTPKTTAPKSASSSAVMAAAEEKRIPLTDVQREMWFASQLGSSMSAAYNESTIISLRGALDYAALERAAAKLIARHEALRTTFEPSGETQRIAAAATPDVARRECAETDENGATSYIEDEVHRPFDLTRGSLLRLRVAGIGTRRHVLAVIAHHIICDGWSLGVLTRELAQLYSRETGMRFPVPTGTQKRTTLGSGMNEDVRSDVPVGTEKRTAKNDGELVAAPQFSEFAVRHAAEKSGPAFAAAEKYWLAQFSDSVPVLELPTDRPRPAERNYRGGFVLRTLSPEATAAVKTLCAQQECTAFTALFGTFGALLHRLSGQDDVVIGMPAAAQVMDGAENLVGHFANMLPVRSRLAEEQSFMEFFAALRRQMDGALEHWRYPFGLLVQKLNLARDSSRVPLAPVVFNTTRRRGALQFADLQAEVVSNPKRFVNFDLNFNFALSEETITFGCYYSTELFDEATIARWVGHFETLLRAIAANPQEKVAQLPLLTETERRTIVHDWNDTAVDFPRERCVHELFEECARQTPDAVAVVGGRERVTYAELNRRADAVAATLRAQGVGPDAPVGIFLERTPALLVAVLGVLKAGGAYVPLDPAYPKDRLAFIVEDTRMPVVVTQRNLEAYWPGGAAVVTVDDEFAGRASVLQTPGKPDGREPRRLQDRRPTTDDLAYVIYTSGSTGKPKGVCVPHRAVVALTAWAKSFYRAEELAGVLYATSATFDVSVFETLVPLCLGGKVIMAENILQLGALPAAGEVTLISGVPSAVAEVLRAKQIPPSVRTVNVAGEPCPQSLVDALYALPQIERVVDVYGPTETTVYSTGGVRERGGRATIGRPLPNETAYILDRHLQPVPVGVPGELYLGGAKLARGYLNRPELTAERFVEWHRHPADESAAGSLPASGGAEGDQGRSHSERLYRTGDLARWLPDGRIEYLGRLDHQVKIRGFRIELGEIESVLAQQAEVRECVVVARADAAGQQRLVAYVVPSPNAAIDARVLRERLAKQLPDYMVPVAVVTLEKLPRTTSGKIDRRALPEPDLGAAASNYVAPRNTTEELIAEIWRDVLALKQIGVNDNFFELGGHSLLATQALTRVRETLGVELTLRQFFLAPTIAGLAPAVEQALIADIKAGADEPESAGVLVTAKD